MSAIVKNRALLRFPIALALAIGILWATALAVIWFSYRHGAEPGGLLHFVARFHVLVVHFPIGLIFLAALMEFLSYFTVFSFLRQSISFVLWLSFLGAVGATLMGYLLMVLEDFSGRAMTLHLYSSLTVVVLVLLALICSLKEMRLLASLLTGIAALTTAASGHFGGAMVHESKYLTEYAPEALKPALSIGLVDTHRSPLPEAASSPPETPISDRLVYAELIAPILDKRCNECHDENKSKGKLRMDTYELLLAGAKGSDHPTIVPGNADESELIVRLYLDEDDDEFMPPQGEPLQPPEVALLKLWINAGAKTETTVAQLGDDPAIATMALAALALQSEKKPSQVVADLTTGLSLWEALSHDEQEARLAEVRLAAELNHFSLMPISAEDSRLQIKAGKAADSFGDEQLKLLEPVAERIAWLDLAHSRVSDEGMKTVRLMRGLERLHLEKTAITDAGVAELAPLSKLQYLNLYGTKVGNGIFETFEKLPRLTQVYAWQTEVDPAAAKRFEQQVNLVINTGTAPPQSSIETSSESSQTSDAKPMPQAVEEPTSPPKSSSKLDETKADAPKLSSSDPSPASAPTRSPESEKKKE